MRADGLEGADLTLPAVSLDEELCEGSHEEGEPHPRAGQRVAERQARPAALGRHHRGRLVQAGKAQPCARGKITILCPERDSCLGIPAVPSSQSLALQHSRAERRFLLSQSGESEVWCGELGALPLYKRF